MLPSQVGKKKYKFVLGFNRDQKGNRETLQLKQFQEDSNIYAGRDRFSGGSWLGINIKTGILVMLTNFRIQQQQPKKSRGKLVYSFLCTSLISTSQIKNTDIIISNKLNHILDNKKEFSPFNMVIVNIKSSSMYYICSQTEQKTPQILNCNTPYGMCNGHLQDLWPKTKHGLTLFQQLIQNLAKYSEQQIHSEMLKILKDNKTFSQSKEDQSSIFIPPYLNQYLNQIRMTKSSTICTIIDDQELEETRINFQEYTWIGKQNHKRNLFDLKIIA